MILGFPYLINEPAWKSFQSSVVESEVSRLRTKSYFKSESQNHFTTTATTFHDGKQKPKNGFSLCSFVTIVVKKRANLNVTLSR